MAEARGTDQCATGRICMPVSELRVSHGFVTDCGLRVLRAMTKLLAQLVSTWFWAFVYDGKIATEKGQLCIQSKELELTAYLWPLIWWRRSYISQQFHSLGVLGTYTRLRGVTM